MIPNEKKINPFIHPSIPIYPFLLKADRYGNFQHRSSGGKDRELTARELQTSKQTNKQTSKHTNKHLIRILDGQTKSE